MKKTMMRFIRLPSGARRLRQIKRKFYNMRVQHQLMLYFFTFSLLPMLLISAACFGLAAKIIADKVQSYAYEMIGQLSENIDHLLSQMETTSLSVAYNSEIQSTLSQILDNHEWSRLDMFRLEQSMILTYDYGKMRDITIRTPQGISFRVPNNTDDYKDGFYPPERLYIPPHKTVWYHNPEHQVIQMVRNIDSTKNFKNIGTLYISLYSGFVDSLATNISFAENGFIMVLDQNHVPIMLKDVRPEYVRAFREKQIGNSGSFTVGIDGTTYRFFYQTSTHTGWISVGVISLNQLFAQIWILGGFIILCILSIGFLAVCIFCKLSAYFANQVCMVTAAMKKTSEGDFSIQLPEELSKNEFNDLHIGFNHMVSRINELIQTVYETRHLQQESEYKALQAQINPHFLYNTLDTICWQAKLQHNEEIFQTAYSLASLFRASVGSKKAFIPVKEEISYIQDYLNIQKARYRDKIEISIAVAPELENVLIPKLILQPIVENAFIHGLEKKRGRGRLALRGIVSEENQMAIFMVEDNGVGMSEKQIEQLFVLDKEKKHSIGLQNVQQRLQILYEGTYNIQIVSVPEEGTTVILRLPTGMPGDSRDDLSISDSMSGKD